MVAITAASVTVALRLAGDSSNDAIPLATALSVEASA
jgi:hypothetical protein